MTYFTEEFLTWLDDHAEVLDKESGPVADSLLEKIAEQGIFGLAVPEENGGKGGSVTEVIDALTELASHSLTAAFAAWGHRTFIENILSSANTFAKENWLADLLTGKLAGATGLSNAVKFLSKVEELNVNIIEEDGKFYLKGRLPWVTDVRADNFVTIFAAGFEDEPNRQPLILTVPSTAENLSRSEDLEFISLQGANTAALTFNKVPLNPDWILSDNATEFLAQTRPEFLGYQFGLAFGLAEKSLSEVEASLGGNRQVLASEWQATKDSLEKIRRNLYKGLTDKGYFVANPRELFQLRIDIVDVVASSLLLELQATGGRGYFKNSTSDFARRWNEGAFLPIVSPSAVQLRLILNAQPA